MGRSRGRATSPRPAPRPASRPAYSAPPPAAPAGHAPPPAMPQQGGGGMMAGLMGTVVQGAALGTGSAMAHRAVDAVMGPRTVQHEHVGGAAGEAAAAAPQAVPTGPCGEQVKGFTECMSRTNGDMAACEWFLQAMQQCKMQYNMA